MKWFKKVGSHRAGPVTKSANPERETTGGSIKLGTIERVLRERYRARDRAVSAALGAATSAVDAIPFPHIVGNLIVMRLLDAAERQGISTFPEKGQQRTLAALIGCALHASFAAKSIINNAAEAEIIDTQQLTDGVMLPIALRAQHEGSEWRDEMSAQIRHAAHELAVQGDQADQALKKFRDAVTLLGVWEAQDHPFGSPHERKLQQLSDAIVKTVAAMTS